MESKLINYEIFISKRPDMEVHTESSINSCINSAYVLLDGECASLISRVEQFNFNENGIIIDRDTKDELYRNDFELNQLQEALVFQVQYVLNMGNDFTIGGGSYSIGNINSSYNRPEGRELIAPGVYKLLSNARVYNLNAFGSFNKQDKDSIPLSTSKEIMERVKNEYVAINQPNAQVGQVAYVNQSNKVDFGNPEDLKITTYNTQRIAGPEGFRTNYYKIDNVPNIAFFGPDMNGTFSAVHRDEVIKMLEDKYGDYFSKDEVLNIIYASGVSWRSDLLYKIDWIVQVVNNKNELLYFQCLEDNINKNPTLEENKQYWKKLTTQEIDLNLIIEQLKPYIDKIIPPLIKEEVKNQLEKLPTTNYIQETKDQILIFSDERDYESYKLSNNLKDDDFSNVGLIYDNLAYTDRPNNFELNQTFGGNLLGGGETGNPMINGGRRSMISLDNNYNSILINRLGRSGAVGKGWSQAYIRIEAPEGEGDQYNRYSNGKIAFGVAEERTQKDEKNDVITIGIEYEGGTKKFLRFYHTTDKDHNFKISKPNDFVDKEYVDTNTTQIGDFGKLNFYSKEIDLPSQNLKSVVLWNNFDMSKCVSIQIWFKRANGGPWMVIPNNDNSSSNHKVPFTAEIAGSSGVGELRLWRLVDSDSNRWVKARAQVIYNGELK